MSLFWSQLMEKYYNYDCIKWLRDDWNCSVIRIAMATGKDGYLEFPVEQMKKVRTVIDACIELGIYIVVDWHSYNAQNEIQVALPVFREISSIYGHQLNILYEINNEPVKVSWLEVVKPYCNLCHQKNRLLESDYYRTPNWSQDIDIAANNPLKDKNVAYAVLFYSGTHKQWLRDKVDTALSKGLAIFVSEFGTCRRDGNGEIDYEETNKWFDFMTKNNLSWCNWSVAYKEETSSILKNGANTSGNWKHEDITGSGNLIRNALKK
jgi:endoglucanase